MRQNRRERGGYASGVTQGLQRRDRSSPRRLRRCPRRECRAQTKLNVAQAHVLTARCWRETKVSRAYELTRACVERGRRHTLRQWGQRWGQRRCHLPHVRPQIRVRSSCCCTGCLRLFASALGKHNISCLEHSLNLRLLEALFLGQNQRSHICNELLRCRGQSRPRWPGGLPRWK